MPPDLQAKAAVMKAEVEAVTVGDGNTVGGGSGGDGSGGNKDNGGRGSSPRFAKISNPLYDPKKCSDMFNLLT